MIEYSVLYVHFLKFLNVLFMWKVDFEKKSSTSDWEISFSCTTQECDNVTTPHYPISALLLSSCHLWEIMNKSKFQTFSSKSGHGRLQEVVIYKRFQI